MYQDRNAIALAELNGNGRSQGFVSDTISLPLCEQCRRFDIQSFATAPEGRKGYTLSSVRDGEREGCEFCSLLLDCVKELPDGEWQQLKTPYVHMTLWEDYAGRIQKGQSADGLCANRLAIWVGGLYTVKPRISEVALSSAEICLAADNDSPAALNNDITGRYLGQNAESEDHFSKIKSWLSECIDHERCNLDISSGGKIDNRNVPLPARCIYVPPGDEGLRLEETNNKRGAYITLSHRWNEETEICKTKKDNYHCRLDGAFGDLPVLFRNICHIAKKLGIRYVWIDSLCIVQDDKIDWEREAPKMSQYYQFSTLSVAGTDPSRKYGLFTQFSDDYQPWSRMARLPYRDIGSKHRGWFYVYKRKHEIHKQYEDEIKNSELLQRGWIVQEWILSRRILWYTPNGLYWECVSEAAQTSFGEKLDKYHRNTQNIPLELKTSFDFSRGDSYDHWYRMVEMYAPTFLSKVPQDRMLALSSLARAIQGRLRHEDKNQINATDRTDLAGAYCAGLWLQDIHRGLLWTITSQRDVKPKLENAASWSWVPFLTNVRWPERTKFYTRRFKITGLCSSKEPFHMLSDIGITGQCPKLRLVRGTSKFTSTNDADEHSVFQLRNTFTCLHIKGIVFDVHIRGYLCDDQQEDVAELTGIGSRDGTHRWRAICSQKDSSRVAGWGSLEQMSLDAGCADHASTVTCLAVSTRKVAVVGHRGWVLDVLYLEHVEERQYRRLGCGAIFDPPLINDILHTGKKELRLV